MSNKSTLLLFVLYFTVFASIGNASDLGYKPGELLVRFAPKPDGKQRTLSEKNDILVSIYGGNIKHSYKLVPGLTVVKLPLDKTIEDALTTFNKSSSILYAEPNYRLKALSTFPNDPNFSQLWGMHNIGQPHPRDYGGTSSGTSDADIDATEAWDISNGANDIIIAVIDTGVDYTHPDLAGNMWVNEAELNGTPGIDDDENGYVDDVYGYDFSNNDGDPIDDNLHGTHCAGTIGAVGNNGVGVAGVCWNVKIMAVKFLDSSGGGWTSDAISCVQYATLMGARVMSNSWGGGDYSDSLKDKIEAADANGVLFVAAAANSGLDNDVYLPYPASYDCNNIISVMATDHNDKRSEHWDRPSPWKWASNYGANSVDLCAPGSDILSTFPTYETSAMSGYGFSTNYETISGTSMATPHVAGACALVWGMNPALSHLEVKDIILDTVDETVPPLECVSQGRLNLYNAIVEAGTQAGKQAVILSKVDDVNGPVLPGDYITYTISFENTVRGPNDANFPFGNLTNVRIVDHLPAEVDCNNPFDPNYNSNDHTYTWNIGTLQEDDSDSVELTVVVNNLAEPLGKITNVCVIEANEIWPKTAIEFTDVNYWSPGVIYVDVNAVGSNSGLSWCHADPNLQRALQKAQAWECNQIWVAEGTYKPTNTNARSISFELLDGVAIYGGFAGTESHPSQRDLTDPNNETILSGDIAAPNDLSDNSYHVVKCENVDNAILDGFTITAGNANAADDPNRCGGGIYSSYSLSSTITNCTFSDNSAFYGGALYDYNSSDVNITNCNFTGNTAKYYGGGIYNYQSSPAVTNCAFSENHAVGYTTYYGSGGGIANYQSSPTIINCTFSGNSALFGSGNHGKGGAIYNTYGSSPTITYCIFSSNLSDANGGGLYNDYSDPNIANCIFSGNKANMDGGGVYNTSSSPKITNCIFTDNFADDYGGGISNKNYSNPNITNCVFAGNKATDYGGGVCSKHSTLYVYNCVFTGNTVANFHGGAMYNDQASPSVTNCIFTGNWANIYGGGIANYHNSSLALTNCTVSGNSAYYGGGICSWNDADANLTNCIFWDNDANIEDEIYDASSAVNVTYSDVKGGWVGGVGNIDEDPCFFTVETPTGSWTENASYDGSTFQSTLTDSGADWAVNQLAGKFVNPDTLNQDLQFFIVSNDVNTINVWSNVESIALEDDTYQIYDYHLTADSNCIDAGDPNGDYTGWTDIDGERRVVDGDDNGTEIVDMGADEYYWSPADFNSDGIVNFFDYALFANVWQKTSDVNDYNDIYDLVDNNCIDYNDLARFCEDWLWQTAWAKAFPFSYGQGMGRSMGMGMSEGLSLTEEILPSASAKKPQPQLTKVDIEEIIKWLAELWLTEDELRKMMSEDEWLKFIESGIQALKSQMQN